MYRIHCGRWKRLWLAILDIHPEIEGNMGKLKQSLWVPLWTQLGNEQEESMQRSPGGCP